MSSERQFSNTEADRALNRVLDAEARARERIEDCRREAAALVEGAEARARRIEDRSEARLLLIHRLADASVERELQSLHVATERTEDGLDAQALARLDQAIERLVDEILGLDAADRSVDPEGRTP